MHRQGRKSTAGTGPIEGMGVGTTTFKSALKKCEARAVKQLCIESVLYA